MFATSTEDLPPVYTPIPDTSNGEHTIQQGPRAANRSQLSHLDQNASNSSKSTSQKPRSSKKLWKQVMLEVRDFGIIMAAGRSGWVAPDVHVPPPPRFPRVHAKSLSILPSNYSISASTLPDKPGRAACRSHTLPSVPSRIFTSISASTTSKTPAAT